MKRIISILVLLSFLWLGFSAYQLLNTPDHFGSAFWTLCLSLSTTMIFSTSRISMIGKEKPSKFIGISALLLLAYSLIAWLQPTILLSSWNFFIALFVLFLGRSLNELFSPNMSLLQKIGFWTPWIFLSVGILLKISAPLFFTSSLLLLEIIMLVSLFTVNRKVSS